MMPRIDFRRLTLSIRKSGLYRKSGMQKKEGKRKESAEALTGVLACDIAVE